VSDLRVGITGAKGFIGRALCQRLASEPGVKVIAWPRIAWNDRDVLAGFAGECDLVVHLAGKNRGADDEIRDVNERLLTQLLEAAGGLPTPPRIIFASSTQRDRHTQYGRSKRWCEGRLEQWVAEDAMRSAAVLVVPNVYGPGSKPFYNSVVATFCHQLAHGEEPTIVEDAEVGFVWINDLVDQMTASIRGPWTRFETETIQITGAARVSELLCKLKSFRQHRFELGVMPDLSSRFDASLFATLESYFELPDHCWTPQVHADDRGRLCEVLKLANGGQVFFSTTRPGVTRGNHFHTRKIEWFCVLDGEAAIRLRRVGTEEVHEFRVSGESPRFVSIPVWHAHQIENVGQRDLLTVFWSNEIFDASDADTHFEKVA
jgi:UDP-2-acetamido-2,6-beta-L-arabino-hexul-4-ose reductase